MNEPRSGNQPPEEDRRRHLRRVVIERHQRNTLEHVRDHLGYAADLDPKAYDRETFRLINQRRELEQLPEADEVLPLLDDWKYWDKMNDWDSRNQLLEDLIGKLRRKEASAGEIYVLVTVCRPVWAGVLATLRRCSGDPIDPRADGKHQYEEAQRVNELDNEELKQVVQHGLIDAFLNCPRPFPRFFFHWLKKTLAFRALEHVRADISEHGTRLPYDSDVRDVVDSVLKSRTDRAAAHFAALAAPGHDQWIRTLDLPALFDVADEYATYARVSKACERAVDRLPDRQRKVIRERYYNEMTQQQIASAMKVSDSTIRNTHSGALKNLRKDDELFVLLEAVGMVRDRARKLQMEAERTKAAA
jgi:RNA polymerase sigma factor (sigma-70 family)